MCNNIGGSGLSKGYISIPSKDHTIGTSLEGVSLYHKIGNQTFTQVELSLCLNLAPYYIPITYFTYCIHRRVTRLLFKNFMSVCNYLIIYNDCAHTTVVQVVRRIPRLHSDAQGRETVGRKAVVGNICCF